MLFSIRRCASKCALLLNAVTVTGILGVGVLVGNILAVGILVGGILVVGILAVRRLVVGRLPNIKRHVRRHASTTRQ